MSSGNLCSDLLEHSLPTDRRDFFRGQFQSEAASGTLGDGISDKLHLNDLSVGRVETTVATDLKVGDVEFLATI